MASVTLRNVTKVFGGRRNAVVAVDDLTIRVADGEMVVLVGPSGCGKTTTLRLVAGLDRVSAGYVEIGGRVVNDVAPKDRDVALVFQDYALYPHLTVYGNLAFGLKMRRTPKLEIQRRVTEVARSLGIEELQERKPHELSGGQRQRVAFGRAIVRRPQVFLFDEPLANLDAQLRVKVRLELRRMQRDLGMTSLYVTHDQYEAMALGDRIAVMAEGRVQQIGPPEEVFERPANRFVAGFLGTPRMNFLDGTLSAVGDSVGFEFAGQRLSLPPRLAARVANRTGERMVLGIRPDRVEMKDVACGTDAEASFPARVSMSETLGDHCNVYARTSDGREIVAKMPASGGSLAGRDVWATVDCRQAALFEPGENGVNIALENEEADVRDT